MGDNMEPILRVVRRQTTEEEITFFRAGAGAKGRTVTKQHDMAKGPKALRGTKSSGISPAFGSVIAVVIALLMAGATMSDLAVMARIVCFGVAFVLGTLLVAWWEIPRLKPHPWIRALCGCFWALFIGTLAFSVIRNTAETDIAISLNATLLAPHAQTPPPEGNGVIYIPSDLAINGKLGQEARQLGYEVGSQPISLRIVISNDGPKAWAAYKIPIVIHYVVRHGIPFDNNWADRGSVDESGWLSNGTWSPRYPNIPIGLSEPVRSYTSITWTLINTSIAYAAVEFPKTAEVQEVGSDRFVTAPLAISGIQMLAPTLLRIEMLPPWRWPRQ